MKKILTVAGMALFGAVMMSAAPVRAQEVFLMKTEVASGYCHMKFPAIQDATDNGAGLLNPVLEPRDTQDIVDFYGPCNYDPTGKAEIHAQRLDRYIASDSTDDD